MTKQSILAIGPSRKAVTYSSLSAASRALSGNGSDSVRGTITNRCSNGGGYLGNIWLQYTNRPISK